MLWLYNFGIFFYGLIIKVLANFNPKAKLFIQGRQKLFQRIRQEISPEHKHIWFHFASLGEFEQGRPVLEKVKENYKEKKIIITFFSPSGYEVRKNYPGVDGIFYLPLDTASNAELFISLINPEIAIFTKYEFWYHYFHLLQKKDIPLFLISGIFRPDQIFFKWYGGFQRKILKCITHLFVQNETSLHLLEKIQLKNISLSGDTRFDRVFENVSSVKGVPLVEAFVGKNPVFIAGSTWPQDEFLLQSLIVQYPDWKVIIAPHEIGKSHLSQLEQIFPSAIKYSQLQNASVASNILIIDNIGLLSGLYQYGKIAYIGGGFGAGIHNTLEAAAFGLPVIFGPEYHKFQEAKDLISLKAAISIRNEYDLVKAFENFNSSNQYGKTAKAYVEQKKGATMGIMLEMEKYLS